MEREGATGSALTVCLGTLIGLRGAFSSVLTQLSQASGLAPDTPVCENTCVSSTWTRDCIYTYTYTCTYTCIYIHTHTYIHACMRCMLFMLYAGSISCNWIDHGVTDAQSAAVIHSKHSRCREQDRTKRPNHYSALGHGSHGNHTSHVLPTKVEAKGQRTGRGDSAACFGGLCWGVGRNGDLPSSSNPPP